MNRYKRWIILQFSVLLFMAVFLAGCAAESGNSALSERADALEQENSELRVALDSLNSKVSDLESQVLTRQPQSGSSANNSSLVEVSPAEMESAKFTFYYVPIAAQRFGVDSLREYLLRWKWTGGAYVGHQFDCSEMSGILEWKLENEGYHTVIVVGDTPGGDGKHAWLLVETTAGHYMPVDAITFDIVDWQDKYFAEYFVYDYCFESIYEALAYGPTEFDWWN